MFWKVVDAPVNVVVPSDIWNVAADPMLTAVGKALKLVPFPQPSFVAINKVPVDPAQTSLMLPLPLPRM